MTVTKEDVEAFSNFCVSLRSIWRHHQVLYEGPELKRELLQDKAPILFGDLNLLLIEHLILQICKITDPEETRGHKNLTVKFLLNNSDFSSDPAALKNLNRLSDRMHDFRGKIVDVRNRLIGHLDRDSVLLGQALGDAPEEDWSQFWHDLQDFLHIIHKHYVDPTSQFYLNGVGYLSDADNLVKALKESAYFQDLLSDSDTTMTASNAAFHSKFYDV